MAEDRFEELLGAYLLGELTVEEERGLERHLEECSRCRSEMDRVRQTHEHLRKLAASEPPPELKARVLAQVRSELPARSIGGWWLLGFGGCRSTPRRGFGRRPLPGVQRRLLVRVCR